MNELDLDQITPEAETPKPRNLEESQDLLSESNFNNFTEIFAKLFKNFDMNMVFSFFSVLYFIFLVLMNKKI